MSDPAVELAITRLRAQWPASGWKDRPPMLAEYRRALGEIAAESEELLARTITRAIDGWDGRFVPQVAHLRDIAALCREEARVPPPVPTIEPTPAWWARLVEGALLASLEDRGVERCWDNRTEAYVQVAREYGLRPGDLLWGPPVAPSQDGMAPQRHSPRIAEAVEAARLLGARFHDEDEAEPQILERVTSTIGPGWGT